MTSFIAEFRQYGRVRRDAKRWHLRCGCICLTSHVGGHGMMKCACTGPCTTARCACRKANRVCNSLCHTGRCCQNLEKCDE
eukprot:840749-Pleurochrysis_carterae.AAC.2